MKKLKQLIIDNYILLKKYQFIIGVLLIVSSFIISRIPFFIYMPIPFLVNDTLQYYNILEALEIGYKNVIGYPNVGYPMMLKLSELIHDSSWFVALFQSLLQLLSILFFFIAYKLLFEKYLFFLSIFLAGYLSSEVNLYFDTLLTPDSLLSSLYIISFALFFLLIKYKKWGYFVILSIIIVYSISVRPSGLVLIPIYVVFLTYYYLRVYKSKKHLYISLSSIVIALFMFALFNYSTNIYNKFNIIIYPKKSLVKENETINNNYIKKISALVDTTGYEMIKYFEEGSNLDSVFGIYRYDIMRGNINVYMENNNLIYLYPNQKIINLDTLLSINSPNYNNYLNLKNYYIKNYKDNVIKYLPDKTLKLKVKLFYMFLKLFYHYDVIDYTRIVGNESRGFYYNHLKYRYWDFYINGRWNDKTKNMYFLVSKNVIKRTAKELWTSGNLKTQKDLDEIYWNMRTGRYFRWIINPLYSVHVLIFKNFLYPIVFIISFIISFIGVIKTKVKSKVFVISILISSLLLMTNFLHSFYFSFVYLRYTYQITFVYYIIIGFTPIIILEIKKILNKP